ncbi:hypothetical protein GB937_003879 [Aspergillus fischeri]|nr:hypothetical protein GB937_003879 [Aspergillus fischeri]
MESSPEGSPCWVEIPARDTEKLKVGSRSCGDSDDFRLLHFTVPFFRPGNGGQLSPLKTKAKCSTIVSLNRRLIEIAEWVFRLGLSGGIVQVPEGCAPTEQIMGSGMTVYYSVDSLDMVEKRIHERGGSTCLAKTTESSHGWFMNFRDPEGNRFGCYEVRRS